MAPYPSREGWTLGIDAYSGQGALAAADLVAHPEIRFAFLKATEGVGSVDSRFRQNAAVCDSVGIHVGAYHFFRPQRDPLRQATEFAETAMQLSHLRPVVDWETLGGMTARDATSAVLCFVNATERLWGVKPILYSYPSMLEQIVYPAAAARLAALAEVCDLWVAHYGAPKPWIPKPWTEVNCLAWQFDGDGFLRLPNGVDCDFDWFMGDEAELVRRWGYTPPMVLAPTTISIRDAQHVLLRLGYRLPIYGADGLSGAETTAALKAFQATIGIPADGRLNAATQSALLLTLSRIG